MIEDLLFLFPVVSPPPLDPHSSRLSPLTLPLIENDDEEETKLIIRVWKKILIIKENWIFKGQEKWTSIWCSRAPMEMSMRKLPSLCSASPCLSKRFNFISFLILLTFLILLPFLYGFLQTFHQIRFIRVCVCGFLWSGVLLIGDLSFETILGFSLLFELWCICDLFIFIGFSYDWIGSVEKFGESKIVVFFLEMNCKSWALRWGKFE